MVLDYLYLILDLLTLSFPLAWSFHKRHDYYKKWHALFPAIFIVGFFYIVWDIFFTRAGIWGFNSNYLIDIDFLHLPLEEWLFFLVVPFSCLFIYEASLFYIEKRPLKKSSRIFSFALAVALIVTAVFNADKAYTSLTFLLAGAFLLFHIFVIKRDYLDRFYIGFLFSLIPFLLVNGVLTGSFIEDQIVWYDNTENLGIRIGTIPLEDSVYLLLYLLSIITIYEAILKRFPIRYQSR